MSASYASCCVLSYERPAFLGGGIDSLLTNAGAPLQLIVHDDGSTDPRVAEELERARQRGATVITNRTGHNEGQGVALNRMFHMASGDPIIKLDQDLTYKPGWLGEVNRILKENRRRLDPALGDHYTRPKEPRIGLLGLLHYHHDPVMSAKCKIAQRYRWQEHTHILGSAFAVLRDCWRTLGPFQEHSEAFAEDWIFQRKVTASENFVCGLPDEDLVVNHGMGLAHSTVVVAEGQVRPIHKEPHVFR